MSRNNFGKIIKSLRQEQIDYKSGRFWTQKDLAEVAQLSNKVIENIEQGRRVNLTRDELKRLASALKLSTLERREFIAAAAEVDQVHEIDEESAKESLDRTWKYFSLIQLPAYLTDPLSNLIGINGSMMDFHGIKSEMLEKACQTEIGCNMLSLFFRPNSPLRSAMSHRWYEPARSNIRQFQFTALRYRYASRFEKMLNLLREYPDFSHLWQQSREAPTDNFSMLRVFDYTHIEHGPVHYATTVTTTLTPHGPLYITIFVACSPRTNTIFGDLHTDSATVRQIMPWPDAEL